MKKDDLLFEQWKTLTEQIRHEDHINWGMFNYFLILNGLLVNALGFVWGSKIDDCALFKFNMIVCLMGSGISLVWTVMHRRGQLYQNYRIEQIKALEDALKLDGERVLNLYEKALNEQNLVSVQKLWRTPTQILITGLGCVIALVWFGFFLGFLWSLLTGQAC